MDEDSFFATFSGMSGKAEYREFSNHHPTVPLMLQGRWMDAICGPEGWDVAMISQKGEILAALPYQIQSKWGLKQIKTPIFTADSGPWFQLSLKETPHGQMADLQTRMEGLIDQLPSPHRCFLKLSFDHHDIQPFLWSRFRAEVMYTYHWHMSDISEMEARANRTVRKAWNKEERGRLQQIGFDEAMHFIQGHHPHWNSQMDATLRHLSEASLGLEAWAYTGDDQPESLVFLVQDRDFIYMLVSSTLSESSNNMSFYRLMRLLFIQKKDQVKTIDLMGSKIKSLAHVFRALGAIPVPHYRLVKYKYRLLECLK